jgi:hypothetical protein
MSPAASPVGERRPGRAGSLLVAVVALGLAAAIIAIGRQPDAAADGSPDRAGIADPAATIPSTGTAPSPSTSSVGAQDPPPTVLTVDEHPVGPVDPEELQVMRVIGAPEVVAFPSAFDRSLRLGGPAAGLCLPSAAPSTAEGSALTLDLHLGELGTGAGRLVVSFAGRATGLTLDLASLATLDRSAWHRLAVTSADGVGRATVFTVADDRPVLDVGLEAGASDVPATAGEVCLHAELQATGTSLFVDNLRVDG